MSRRRAIINWAPTVVWTGIILVGTSAPRLPPGPDIPASDKVAHLGVYGVLGLLLMRALRAERWPQAKSVVFTLLAGGLFAALDELHQSLIPGRQTDLLDFIADCAGLVIAVCATALLGSLTGTPAPRVSLEQVRTDEEMTFMAEALHADQDTFASDVLNANTPALVDFWAPWCGPCQMMGPTIDKLAGDYAGKAVIAKVNVDDSPDLASKYGIRSIPALLFFKGGEVVDQLIGVQSEDTLKRKLDALA